MDIPTRFSMDRRMVLTMPAICPCACSPTPMLSWELVWDDIEARSSFHGAHQVVHGVLAAAPHDNGLVAEPLQPLQPMQTQLLAKTLPERRSRDHRRFKLNSTTSSHIVRNEMSSMIVGAHRRSPRARRCGRSRSLLAKQDSQHSASLDAGESQSSAPRDRRR